MDYLWQNVWQKELTEDKKKQRTEYLKARDMLSLEYRESASESIFAKVKDIKAFKEAKVLLIYCNYKSEVITENAICEYLSNGEKAIYLPKVSGEDMHFYKIDSLSQISEGYRGIREPYENDYIFDENINSEDAVLIIPGAAFDKKGNRIGYGKGFYDRFLKKYPKICKIGIAFGVQMCKNMISSDYFDEGMDYVVTENECIDCTLI